jgi:large subunit ribosomal protein L35
MPKIKTHKTAAKRFKVTGTGKLMRRNARKGHLMINKSGSRHRRLDMDSKVSAGEVQKIHRLVPNLA